METKAFELALTEAEKAAQQLKEDLTRARALVVEARMTFSHLVEAAPPRNEVSRTRAFLVLHFPSDVGTRS